jgi:hypothetical protein
MKRFNTQFILVLLLISSAFIFYRCENESEDTSAYLAKASNPIFLHQTMQNLTETIVNDIFSPPVASRIYFYTSLAAYEVLVQGAPNYLSLKGQIKGFEGIPLADTAEAHLLPLAAVVAMLEINKKLVYTSDLIKSHETKILADFQALGVQKSVFDRSVAYGKSAAEAIWVYAGTDKYKESRTLMRYTVSNNPGDWQPTPPEFKDPVEPNWNTIRPLVLDSASQFAPPPPTPFSMDKNSQFYKELMVVYNAVKNLTEEQGAIAEFWDCNPFAVEMLGHLPKPTKKISPGGHWMGIAQMASQQSKADLIKSTAAYMATSIALFDAFISCWDEKYRSNLIRPETVINTQGIDLNWKPLLQTPPFPEYTSGHSVASGASAVALTYIFGDNFAYIDSVEVNYGLPPRAYPSFTAASEEAAISRLYGGIHYMPAIQNGIAQGRAVGNFIIKNVKLKKD